MTATAGRRGLALVLRRAEGLISGDLPLVADAERDPLVDRLGGHVEDSLAPRRRRTAGALRDVSHGDRFIKEAQLA